MMSLLEKLNEVDGNVLYFILCIFIIATVAITVTAHKIINVFDDKIRFNCNNYSEMTFDKDSFSEFIKKIDNLDSIKACIEKK